MPSSVSELFVGSNGPGPPRRVDQCSATGSLPLRGKSRETCRKPVVCAACTFGKLGARASPATTTPPPASTCSSSMLS